MKKQYRIRREHPNLVNIDLIEDGKVVGGYIASQDRVEFFMISLVSQGYTNQGYEGVNELETLEMKKEKTRKEALKDAIKAIIFKIYQTGVAEDIERILNGDEFWNRKAEEIIREVSTRYPIGI